MNAAQISRYGDASVISINNIPTPTLKDSQVLVRVRGSSINPFDTILREGVLKDSLPLEFPFTLGGDFAGEVAEVSPDVTHLKIGDHVYGQAYGFKGGGTFAEFVAAPADQTAILPKNLTFIQAGSLPLVGASAIQALQDKLGLKAGHKIFIHGGAGGIGSIAIQIAKHLGAYVATTATGPGIDTVKQLGADQAIDYKIQDFSTQLSDFDAVFDTVGGNDFTKSFAILKKGGKAATMAAQPSEDAAKAHGITAVRMSTKVDTNTLNKLRELVEQNIVKPQIGKTFTLDQVAQAFEARESGSVSGKVALEITRPSDQ